MKNATSPIPTPSISYARLVGAVVEYHRTHHRQKPIHQEEMAQALSISQSAYSRLELGQTAMSITQLRMIAEKLGTTSEDLLKHVALYAKQLKQNGVEVIDEKPASAAGVLIAMGILAALIAAVG